MNFFLFLSILILVFTIFLVVKYFILPKIRSNRLENFLNSTNSKKIKLLELEKQVSFHLNWARDRGDSTVLYEQELKNIHSDLENLKTNHPESEPNDIN